jgi:hypothetical protein
MKKTLPFLLLGFALLAQPAFAINYCYPNKTPLNGVSCANEVCDPNSAGTSTYDADKQNLIACLADGVFADGTTKTTWKIMSTGSTVIGAVVGGGSYTAWGTTSCASGWTTAYTGVAAVSTSTWTAINSMSSGGLICKYGSGFTQTSSGMPTQNHIPAIAWTTSASYSGSTWAAGYSLNEMPCAVCVK